MKVVLATGYAELPKGGDTTSIRLAKPFTQDQLAAVLAEAIDMSNDPKEFFASSNGDTWHLVYDGVTGEPTVLHRANMASGGAETRMQVGRFLEIAGSHPQGQALRDILVELSSSEAVDGAAVERKPKYDFPWAPRTGHTGD
ncbi:hypothetical protein CO657_31205 (plasmid) [Rhizobium acidisoli]|uniref:Uncharacterized protein n=1 Tax=Rhizobium acidisoli TaxID=1538158 RepID=A0AAE5WTM1_9HYPH|nr:hypothetical protein [Rhizobium acidisoli]KPH04614.1 hypothetical protein AOG23_32045 [Rhizobium acidisoli]QAS82277.1 hypothetical protein CO657_31205 [Rhizobium acidisoli]